MQGMQDASTTTPAHHQTTSTQPRNDSLPPQASIANQHALLFAKGKWRPEELLHFYMFCYCRARSFDRSASSLLEETGLARLQEAGEDLFAPIDTSQSLLWEWWSTFCEVFTDKCVESLSSPAAGVTPFSDSATTSSLGAATQFAMSAATPTPPMPMSQLFDTVAGVPGGSSRQTHVMSVPQLNNNPLSWPTFPLDAASSPLDPKAFSGGSFCKGLDANSTLWGAPQAIPTQLGSYQHPGMAESMSQQVQQTLSSPLPQHVDQEMIRARGLIGNTTSSNTIHDTSISQRLTQSPSQHNHQLESSLFPATSPSTHSHNHSQHQFQYQHTYVHSEQQQTHQEPHQQAIQYQTSSISQQPIPNVATYQPQPPSLEALLSPSTPWGRELVAQCIRQLNLGGKSVDALTQPEKTMVMERIRRIQLAQASAQNHILRAHSGMGYHIPTQNGPSPIQMNTPASLPGPRELSMKFSQDSNLMSNQPMLASDPGSAYNDVQLDNPHTASDAVRPTESGTEMERGSEETIASKVPLAEMQPTRGRKKRSETQPRAKAARQGASPHLATRGAAKKRGKASTRGFSTSSVPTLRAPNVAQALPPAKARPQLSQVRSAPPPLPSPSAPALFRPLPPRTLASFPNPSLPLPSSPALDVERAAMNSVPASMGFASWIPLRPEERMLCERVVEKANKEQQEELEEEQERNNERRARPVMPSVLQTCHPSAQEEEEAGKEEDTLMPSVLFQSSQGARGHK